MSASETPSFGPLSAALAVVLADHTSDFVGVVDDAGRALFLNRSVRGASNDEVEGKLLEQFLSLERATRIRAMLREARATGAAVVDKDVRIDAVDGSERWFIEKCVPFQESDGSPRFLLVRTEQTHLRRAEADLRASEARYRTLFESNPDPVVVVEQGTLRILAANPAAVRLYGYEEAELRALTWDALFHEDELAHVGASVVAGRGEHRQTLRQRRRDGSVVVADIVDNPIVLNGVHARVAVVRDRTELERLEAELRHAQKMEAMGVFAGGIAHDFNNLLGVISACATGVREVVADDASAHEDLESLENAVVRGANLTKKLMLFCRRLTTSRVPLDLVGVIDELSVVLRRLLSESAALVVEHRAASAPILGDQTELEQLVSNLVLNAGQAGSTRIVVRTKLARIREAPSHLPRARPGDYVELSVEDDGHGMDEATLQRIFEPFFTTKACGTGLGLSVVHGVVERHEGHLVARSKPGGGTVITTYLPAAIDASGRASTGRLSHRILFAEDDDALRRLTERMLRRLGYDVVSACDGEEAVRVFEASPHEFDFVLLDVIMPKLKGPDAYTRMRAIRPELEALFVSGFAGDAVDRGLSLRILHKPFTAPQLADALRRLHRPARVTGWSV